jgi:hypothetical protein
MSKDLSVKIDDTNLIGVLTALFVHEIIIAFLPLQGTEFC